MPLLLLVLFIGIPIAEIWAINQVQSFLGWPTTIVILVLDSIAGAYLVRMQGALAWKRFTQALAEARVPTQEIADGALILMGGALLLTPGFLTDAVGLAMVFGPTRQAIGALLRRRIRVAPGGRGTVIGLGTPRGRTRSRRDGPDGDDQAPPTPPRPPRQPGVIDVEVVDVQRNRPDPDER